MTNLELLESLSKEDLIAVIANLVHSGKWIEDKTLSIYEKEIIGKVSSACQDYWANNIDCDLPNL